MGRYTVQVGAKDAAQDSSSSGSSNGNSNSVRDTAATGSGNPTHLQPGNCYGGKRRVPSILDDSKLKNESERHNDDNGATRKEPAGATAPANTSCDKAAAAAKEGPGALRPSPSTSAATQSSARLVRKFKAPEKIGRGPGIGLAESAESTTRQPGGRRLDASAVTVNGGGNGGGGTLAHKNQYRQQSRGVITPTGNKGGRRPFSVPRQASTTMTPSVACSGKSDDDGENTLNSRSGSSPSTAAPPASPKFQHSTGVNNGAGITMTTPPSSSTPRRSTSSPLQASGSTVRRAAFVRPRPGTGLTPRVIAHGASLSVKGINETVTNGGHREMTASTSTVSSNHQQSKKDPMPTFALKFVSIGSASDASAAAGQPRAQSRGHQGDTRIMGSVRGSEDEARAASATASRGSPAPPGAASPPAGSTAGGAPAGRRPSRKVWVPNAFPDAVAYRSAFANAMQVRVCVSLCCCSFVRLCRARS